jgi:hypothetical protein
LLPFGITVVEFGLVTFVAAFVGVALVVLASKYVKTQYLAAFAVGIYLWYFTDTLGDANYLNVDSGFVFSYDLIGLIAVFVIGLFLFLSLDGKLFGTGEENARFGLLVAILAALSLGLHGFGEGADFGFTASTTQYNTLFDAFGGLTASASWVMHKMLEPTIAAVAYVALAGVRSKSASERAINCLTLAVVFVTPPILGAIAGYYLIFDHTYVFALGLGASVYALFRVAGQLYSPGPEKSSWLSFKMALAAVIGFLLIFISALLH